MSRSSIVAVVLLGLAAHASAAEPKRPTVAIASLSDGDRYTHSAGIAVAGRVEPTVESSVEVTAYHVRDDGGLVPLGRADAPILANGEYACTLRPASPGWRPGTLRVVARLGVMPHLRVEREIEVVDPGRPLEDWVIYEKKSSGVVVDLDAAVKFPKIPPGERFLVRRVTAGTKSGRGQMWKLVERRGQKEVINDSAPVNWLRDGETSWTEREFVMPPGEGSYEVRLEQQPGSDA